MRPLIATVLPQPSGSELNPWMIESTAKGAATFLNTLGGVAVSVKRDTVKTSRIQEFLTQQVLCKNRCIQRGQCGRREGGRGHQCVWLECVGVKGECSMGGIAIEGVGMTANPMVGQVWAQEPGFWGCVHQRQPVVHGPRVQPSCSDFLLNAASSASQPGAERLASRAPSTALSSLLLSE